TRSGSMKTIGRYRKRMSSASSRAGTESMGKFATGATRLPSPDGQGAGAVFGRRTDCVDFPIRELIAPAGLPSNLDGAVSTKLRRQPRDVDQTAAERAQPDPQKLLVENRRCFVLDRGKCVGREREAGVQSPSLSDLSPRQPRGDVVAIVPAQRRVGEKGPVRIAAEKASGVNEG